MHVVYNNIHIRLKAVAHFYPIQKEGKPTVIHEVMEIDLTFDIDDPQMMGAILQSIKAINGIPIEGWSDVNIEVIGANVEANE